MGQRHDGGSFIHGIEDRAGEVAMLRTPDGHYFGAGAVGGLAPRIDVGGKLLGE